MIVPAVGNPGHLTRSFRGQGTREQLLLPLGQCFRSDRIHMIDPVPMPGIGDGDGASGSVHQQRRLDHNVVAHKLIGHRTFEVLDKTDHIVAQHHTADKIPDDSLEKNVTDRRIQELAHIDWMHDELVHIAEVRTVVGLHNPVWVQCTKAAVRRKVGAWCTKVEVGVEHKKVACTTTWREPHTMASA